MNQPAAADHPAQAPHRILAVDDDPILLELLHETFTGLGYQVCLSDGVPAAAGRLEHERFDLAIIDLNMPKIDGFELLRQIRGHAPTATLPVIVATASGDKASIDRAYELGASSFVTKPINWTQFAHHVQFVIRTGQIERDLRQAEADAAATARMKNGLFNVLGHELKTPLTALVGLTDVLVNSLGKRLNGLDAEHLELVNDAAQRLNHTVGDVLLLARALAGAARLDKAWHPAHDLLEESLAGFGSRAAKQDITLRLAPVAPGLELNCDGGLVQQALRRLIDNAIKFSPPGQDIVLAACQGARGEVCLSVTDRGPGISMARLRDCLEPFVQSDMSYSRPAEGLGLGLPIAHTIAEAHGGGLTVSTTPGQGLTATLCLPASTTTKLAA